jgi:hypothetical protein
MNIHIYTSKARQGKQGGYFGKQETFEERKSAHKAITLETYKTTAKAWFPQQDCRV